MLPKKEMMCNDNTQRVWTIRNRFIDSYFAIHVHRHEKESQCVMAFTQKNHARFVMRGMTDMRLYFNSRSKIKRIQDPLVLEENFLNPFIDECHLHGLDIVVYTGNGQSVLFEAKTQRDDDWYTFVRKMWK